MIKILHIVSSLYKNSGVMSVIMNYYRHIDNEKVQFDFMCFKDPLLGDNYINEIKNRGGNFFFIESRNSIDLVQKIRFFLKSNNSEYDFFQNHEVYLTYLIQSFNVQSGKIITYSHTTQYSDYLSSSIRNRILCFPIRHKKYIKCACSNDAGKFLYNNKKYYVFNNAIEITKYKYNSKIRQTGRAKYGLKNSDIVIGNIGRLSAQKNQIYLLRIMKDIIEYDNSYKLLLIGDGPLYANIIDYVRENNLHNNVIYVRNTNDVPYFLNMMDLLVMPSLYEGLPVVAVEAQCNGLRCILSENITHDVLLTDVVFLNLENKKQWIDCIINKINKSRIKDATGILQDHGFNIETESKQLLQFYQSKLEQLK